MKPITLKPAWATGLQMEGIKISYNKTPDGDHWLSLDDFTDCDCCKPFTAQLVNAIVEHFDSFGYHVTKQAIYHNYGAWLFGNKSGYIDNENNYHIKTPFGYNRLSFTASKVKDKPQAWQTTYSECYN